MTRAARAVAQLGATALLVIVAACGSSGTGEASRREHQDPKPADTGVCAARATAVPTPYGGQFPAGWPFPPGTTVYDVEDRGEQGTVVTAISTAAFADILRFLNHDVVDAGFRIESGETEEHDAEAEWSGNGHRGRWAIRTSAQCPGETVVQVLAAEGAR